MRGRRALAAGVLLAALTAGCARDSTPFSETNARAHVSMLAGTIGSRPAGTPANARARAYIVDQLKLYGFEVRIQEADARRPELGRTARVANIIATLGGSRPEAIGLVAHYDSVPDGPGAADDGLGVGVALEAARILAARPSRQWSLMVLVTDGEEAELMGAAALVTDREVTRRLQAYLQVEATGSAGRALLFETGPGNGWLVSAWARSAPAPRGASFAAEIYRQLPNDTDFSILKRLGIPGLNFAPVGDSYAYHTALDTPDRLRAETLRTTGDNIVAAVEALDRRDITRRTAGDPTFFDVGGTFAVSYGPLAGRLLTIAALVLGVVAWVRASAAAIRAAGVLRWILTFVWVFAGAALTVAAMVGVTWALRLSREVYHPWYAHPRRLFVLLAIAAFVAAWSMTRLGQWLPSRLRGHRHPVMVWSVTLPAWILLACAALWFSPGAVFLVGLPLLTAGVLLASVPPVHDPAVRLASWLAFAVGAALWLPYTILLLEFLVPLFGRLPIVTPPFIYAAVMALAGSMVVPPVVAALLSTRRLFRPSVATALGLLALAAAAAFAYAAPAYTAERPLRRVLRVVQPEAGAASLWEVASTEPGLDLAPDAPDGWIPGPPGGGAPWGWPPLPFAFHRSGPPLGAAPAQVLAPSITPVAAGIELQMTVVPAEPGISVTFVLPRGIEPARANLPGLVRDGAWAATYVAPPSDGIVFRASFAGGDPARLAGTRVLVGSSRIPGGDGWQQLPPWLPRDRMVWSARAFWLVAPPFAGGLPLQ